MEAPNSDDICLHCGGKFEKPPQRKTRCKHCGEHVFVKGRPSDRVRRLVTEAQAFDVECEWTRYYAEQQVTNDARSLGIDDDAIIAALRRHRDCTEALRELCFTVIYSTATPQTRSLAAKMIAVHAARDREDRLTLQRLALQFSLDQAIELARFGEMKRYELRTSEKECASCSGMIGRCVVEKHARTLLTPPDDCPRVEAEVLCGLYWAPLFE